MYFCPKPAEWARVHEQLISAYHASEGADDQPPKPLILGGWAFSSAREKHERWQATLEWAVAHGLDAVTASVAPDAFEYWVADIPAWFPEESEDVAPNQDE